MTATVTPTGVPAPPPANRPPTLFRRWRFWAVAGLVLILAAGWTVAFYVYGRSQDNAASVSQLTGANADLKAQVDGITEERDRLIASRGAAEAAVKSREDAAKSHEDALKKREDDLAGREAAAKKREDDVKAREDAVTQQEKVQAQNTISEGNWAVGVDVQPGTYRTKEPVADHCYWGIYADANGRNIVANDIVTGGRPTVTLKSGQFFTTTRCGDWIKV